MLAHLESCYELEGISKIFDKLEVQQSVGIYSSEAMKETLMGLADWHREQAEKQQENQEELESAWKPNSVTELHQAAEKALKQDPMIGKQVVIFKEPYNNHDGIVQSSKLDKRWPNFYTYNVTLKNQPAITLRNLRSGVEFGYKS